MNGESTNDAGGCGILAWTWDGDEVRATLDGRPIGPDQIHALEESIERLGAECSARIELRRREALEARARAARRVVEMHGRRVVIQAHLEQGHDVAAWLDGHERSGAPFVVEIYGMGGERPWTIAGAHVPGRGYRSHHRGRYGSIHAAVGRALALMEAGDLGENPDGKTWN